MVGESKADFALASQRTFGSKVNTGKADIVVVPSAVDDGAQIPNCPNNCKTGKVVKDGKRTLNDGSRVQRYYCMTCGMRFSDNTLKTEVAINSACQICAKGAKNLHVPKPKHYGTGELNDETKAMLKVFEGWLQKQGYAQSRYPNDVKTLAYIGADLLNPESIKEVIGAHKVKNGSKMLLCYAYEAFMKMHNATSGTKLSWERPEYHQEEIIPFIPEESELDQLIAAAQSKRMAAYLQTLKETFTDPSEALRIQRDTDINGNLITIRYPVKNHRPRTLEVSDKCIAMVNMAPRKSNLLFDCRYSVMNHAFLKLKKRVATKTKNDRIIHVELRSFRHYAGTKIAELSNGNPITVMKALGLKNIDNAMKYINIWKLSFRTETQWEYMTVTTPDEMKIALLGGFEYVIDKFGASWFRRQKRIAIAGTPITDRADEPQCPPLETPIIKRKDALVNL
ncbi:MAG: hypothetical protein ACQCN3_02845 [Candidatus Bathyarchaeia archaeon]|jgi:hypothetical protein